MPWRMSDQPPGRISVVTEAGELVATVHDEHQDAHKNARLIAAAPELFEFTRSLAHLLEPAQKLVNRVEGR